MVGLRENQEIYRDKRGKVINVGDIVVYRKMAGIIREEDREGLYIELKNGYKLRLSAFDRKIRIVSTKEERRIRR